MKVEDIRKAFRKKYESNIIRNNGTLELQGVSFIADEPAIFGTANGDYIKAEIAWYNSKDRRVQTLFDLYGKTVKIWNDVQDEHGEVNSNYGWCIHSTTRHCQYNTVYHTLREDPTSRQAVMIYTTPEMHEIAGKDFTCTNAVQYFINDGILDAIVQMRSNDAIFGYANDRAWQIHVLVQLANDLGIKAGQITWQVGSMHIYERHWKLIV